MGFGVSSYICFGDGLGGATIGGLGIERVDPMLNHNGRAVVATDNAGAKWPDVRANRAIDILNIGRRKVRDREHCSLRSCHRGQQSARADEGGGRATNQLT